MRRTNVVGTTAAAGSGAQRCAQAGERKHRTDTTTGTAVTTAANRLSDVARGRRAQLEAQWHIPVTRMGRLVVGSRSALRRRFAIVDDKAREVAS